MPRLILFLIKENNFGLNLFWCDDDCGKWKMRYLFLHLMRLSTWMNERMYSEVWLSPGKIVCRCSRTVPLPHSIHSLLGFHLFLKITFQKRPHDLTTSTSFRLWCSRDIYHPNHYLFLFHNHMETRQTTNQNAVGK